MAHQIQVNGARELRRNLRRLGTDLKDLSAVHQQAASLVATAATAAAPRRTGRLAATIRPGKTQTTASVRAGNARVPYAQAIHWGTGRRPGKRGPHNIRRRPFILNAAQALTEQITHVYNNGIDRLVDRANQGAIS